MATGRTCPESAQRELTPEMIVALPEHLRVLLANGGEVCDGVVGCLQAVPGGGLVAAPVCISVSDLITSRYDGARVMFRRDTDDLDLNGVVELLDAALAEFECRALCGKIKPPA